MSRRLLVALLAASMVSACGEQKREPEAASPAKVAASAVADGFTPLFDLGMTQWRGWKSDSMPTTGWVIADGMISKDGAVSDLTTRASYANFELEFDWQVGPMGNAGVFYRVTDDYDKPYWSGPEYQLRDEAMDPERKNLALASASVYNLYAPPGGLTKPLGEWNHARIVVNGTAVQHWLNGQQVVTYDLASPDFAALVKATKFSEYPKFGTARRGTIAIQGDHNGSLGLRNMRIRALP